MHLHHSQGEGHNAKQALANVLYIEDSLADVALTKAMLKHNCLNFHLHFLRDGEEAIDCFKSGDYKQLSPDLILLDFNLPKATGIDVLEFIKANHDFAFLPVIMLSGSDAPSDIEKATGLGAAYYMNKPLKGLNLKEAVASIPSLSFVELEGEQYLYAVK